jgi:hypothetical protein
MPSIRSDDREQLRAGGLQLGCGAAKRSPLDIRKPHPHAFPGTALGQRSRSRWRHR